MRWMLFLVPAMVALAIACNQEPAPANVCEEAAQRFATCGASLGFVTHGTCAGARKLVARCVVDHARDCDELAGLYRNIDACVASLADGGDDLLPPLTDLPVDDGGPKRHDASLSDSSIPIGDAETKDASADATKDAP